jgi:hypothetical protein
MHGNLSHPIMTKAHNTGILVVRIGTSCYPRTIMKFPIKKHFSQVLIMALCRFRFVANLAVVQM